MKETFQNGAEFMYFLILTVLVVALPMIVGILLTLDGDYKVGLFLVTLSGIVLASALFGLAVKAGADSISAGLHLADNTEFIDYHRK